MNTQVKIFTLIEKFKSVWTINRQFHWIRTYWLQHFVYYVQNLKNNKINLFNKNCIINLVIIIKQESCLLWNFQLHVSSRGIQKIWGELEKNLSHYEIK